jgi:hypothetical protein
MFAMVLALGFCLCSCESATLGSHAHATPGSLLTVLHVTRTPRNSASPVTFDKTFTDAKVVQRLYSAAIALPKFTEQSCGTQTQGYVFFVYHLTFLQATIQFAQMTLDDYGCMGLTIDPGDYRTTNLTFISLFAQTIGVSAQAV